MRQCKRFEIADRLAGELQIIPESRMLTVVGQAMKYKRYIGELPMNIGQNVVKSIDGPREPPTELTLVV